ncbi:hypothetical protein ABW19_dt0210103 [Dactylella cylindrospora]|nr:hypothetical protein ABW19_dt0210103 [Dactylella cylindrospora]
MEPTNLATPLTPLLPVELEIEIIRHVPFKYYRTLRFVCKRWYSITLLDDVKYVHVTSQIPETPPPNFEAFNFKLHRAIYEVDQLWSNEATPDGLKMADKETLSFLSPYQDDPLTIPPLPHTLQDVKISMALPPSPIRPCRPGHVFKAIVIPSKKHRMFELNGNYGPNPDIYELFRNATLPPITIGQVAKSLIERARMRSGDIVDRMELKWRVNAYKGYWKEVWGLKPGFYDVLLIRNGARVTPWAWTEA